MDINRAAFGALAVFGIVAAGGGAYLANRHNDAAMETAPQSASPVASAVTETENSIATPAIATQPAPFVADEPAPAPSRPAPVARPVAPKQAATAPAKADRAPAPVRATPPASQRARTNSGANASTSSPTYASSGAPMDSPVSAAIEPLETTTVERGPVVQEPARKLYDELVIPADSVIGLQVENAVTTERAKIEDTVRARVTRDVRVRDQVAIPAGARAEGSVTLVERGGRLKDQARLGIRFHTIVLADGTRLPINTETIYRDGESPARESAAKIGGAAVGGAVLGAILGGKKGAIIGSTVGAAGGGVAVATSEANAATLPQGSTVTVRMGAPATVTVER
jgi:type IV secretory pathway VirB10-like protein